MINANGVIISAILTLVIYIIAVFFWGKEKKASKQQEILLSDIAQLWANSQRSGQLHIKEIAPLWRRSNTPAAARSEYVFRSLRVERFFIDTIESQPWFDQAEAHKEICYQVLRMLEEEGDCPSVVNPSNDVEASWDTNTYTLLGRTTLLNHSLHVAEHTVALLLAADAHHVIPDAMIAALAHDIGKLPSNRSHLYSLGEHPLAAGRILAETILFKELSRKEEITRAIKQHHMRPEGLLGKTLKKADQKARQQELEETVERQGKTVEDQSRQDVQQERLSSPQSASHPDMARQADADIYGENDGQQTPPRKDYASPAIPQVNISTWFDGQAFLDELKPYINRVEGRRFMAFSMPTGHIYFQVRVIEEVTRSLAEKAGAMDIAMMAEKDKSMQKVLLSVVEQFRTEYDVIARDLIKDQYFGGYFTIRMHNGKGLKGYYTPFKAEAFGSIAELENDKKGILKRFISVEAYRN